MSFKRSRERKKIFCPKKNEEIFLFEDEKKNTGEAEQRKQKMNTQFNKLRALPNRELHNANGRTQANRD